ncbi:hypothetical protein LZ009_05500 [Ramlibacter sp. XY19]|uniref:hypothetical protein n=1 Tax=Ramlibacter paludis TaxID=2908000 RepID=UPI0023DC0607|nr:hypothetical protein [Ramlibacter paludis]MCG2592232.1 hypothetical protein [Ramlibacter paludis]
MFKKSIFAVAAACSFGLACGAFAADATGMSKDQYKAGKDKIEAQHKADKKGCDGMKGNARDVCEKEAKGKEKVALAQLEEQYKPSARHEKEAERAQAKANYEVAKEKCEDMKGKTERDCKTQAKAELHQAKADTAAH